MKVPFRRSLSKIHARADSTQSQPTVPLLREETVEDSKLTPKTDDEHTRQTGREERNMVPHGHDTVLVISQKKAELLHFGSEQNMSTLQDLSNMLYTRRRLQELGCTFTPPGELLTYGHPTTLQEFEQLLRLGPIYDEQWALFFHHRARSDEDDEMWADMRTLKRMLINECVKFGPDHDRLTFGNGSPKIHRLCSAYDDLYKLWSAMLPETPLTPHQEGEEIAADANDDSGCFMQGAVEQGGGVEEPVKDDLDQTEYETRPGTEVPQNIGWRFSDDIDRAAYSPHHDSSDPSDDDIFESMEAALEIAVAVPLLQDLTRPSSPVPPVSPFQKLNKKASKELLEEKTVEHENPFKVINSKATIREEAQPRPALQPRRRYGPSPLQAVTTVSMVCVEEPKVDQGNIDPAPYQDANVRDSAAANRYQSGGGEGSEGAKKPKKGLRGWARSVWEKAWSPMKDAQKDAVGQVGGWW